MPTIVTSKKFSLSLNDFTKGLIVAVLTTPLTTLYTSLQAGSFNVDWRQLGLVAVTGAIGYLIKNFFTPSQVIIKDPPESMLTTTTTI